jgi:hypothetical protein
MADGNTDLGNTTAGRIMGDFWKYDIQ